MSIMTYYSYSSRIVVVNEEISVIDEVVSYKKKWATKDQNTMLYPSLSLFSVARHD